MKIEVAVLLFNRPQHGLRVIESLVSNGVTRARAFLDYSNDPEVVAGQERMVEAIASVPEIAIELHRHTRRMGLAGSVRFALNTTLAQADAAILLEDDCVVRPGGITYFREALATLRDDLRIRSVCGYLFPCPFIRQDGVPLLLRRFSSWGWATWRDRWLGHEPDPRHVLRLLADRGVRLPDVAGDLAALCDSPDYLENRFDVWSVPWALEHFATDTFAVYPSESVIDNIGFDGTGQHCLPGETFTTPGRDVPTTWDWDQLAPCPENDEMLRRFMDEHGAQIYPQS